MYILMVYLGGFGGTDALIAVVLVVLFLLLRHVKKIRKDPRKSLMYSEGWDPQNMTLRAEDEGMIKETRRP